MVLATEMTRHFEHVSKFVNSINKPIAALEETNVNAHFDHLFLKKRASLLYEVQMLVR